MALAPCLFLVCRLSKTKKYTFYDRFHGNGPNVTSKKKRECPRIIICSYAPSGGYLFNLKTKDDGANDVHVAVLN